MVSIYPYIATGGLDIIYVEVRRVCHVRVAADWSSLPELTLRLLFVSKTILPDTKHILYIIKTSCPSAHSDQSINLNVTVSEI